MDQVSFRRGDFDAVASCRNNAPGGMFEIIDRCLDLRETHRAGGVLISIQKVEKRGSRYAIGVLRFEAGVGVSPGVAELNDVPAFFLATATSLDLAYRIAQRLNKAVIVQRRIFERRHPRFVDADGWRDNSGDAGFRKSFLEMNPGRRHRPVVIRISSTHRGTKYSICKCYILDSKRLK